MFYIERKSQIICTQKLYSWSHLLLFLNIFLLIVGIILLHSFYWSFWDPIALLSRTFKFLACVPAAECFARYSSRG